MKTINTIMVAIDFSKYSLKSIKFTAKLARDVGAELLLVNVINRTRIDDLYKIEEEYPEFSVKSHIEDLRKDRQHLFDELIAASECSGLDVKTEILLGFPFEALLRFIEKRKPDLLVISTKGRSNLVATVIGSCAQRLFRHSPIPLLSIR